MTSPLSPEVISRWLEMNAPLEGRVAYMYCDSRALVTCAVGNLIDPEHLAHALPWRCPDGVRATHEQVSAEWARVKAIGLTGGPRGYVFTHYHSPNGLHLDDEDIDALVLQRLDACAVALAKRWPAFGDWPWQAQAAVCLLCWAVGEGSIEHGWPHLDAALDREDWQGAHAAGVIASAGNPGVIPRNKLVAELFEAAALSA